MPSVPLAAAFDVSAPRYLHRGCERADHLLSVGSRTDYKQIARRWDRRRRPRANAGGTVCASSAATPNSPSAHATSAASAKRASTEARQAARRYRRVAAAPSHSLAARGVNPARQNILSISIHDAPVVAASWRAKVLLPAPPGPTTSTRIGTHNHSRRHLADTRTRYRIGASARQRRSVATSDSWCHRSPTKGPGAVNSASAR